MRININKPVSALRYCGIFLLLISYNSFFLLYLKVDIQTTLSRRIILQQFNILPDSISLILVSYSGVSTISLLVFIDKISSIIQLSFQYLLVIFGAISYLSNQILYRLISTTVNTSLINKLFDFLFFYTVDYNQRQQQSSIIIKVLGYYSPRF